MNDANKNGQETTVRTRELVRAFIVVAVVAALIIGIGAWFVFSFVLVCGCTRPA